MTVKEKGNYRMKSFRFEFGIFVGSLPISPIITYRATAPDPKLGLAMDPYVLRAKTS